MSSPSTLFFMDGPCGDLEYLNTRDHPRGAKHKAFVEQLWERCYQLTDPHSREDARNHFHQRFWEMYLTVSLLERGFDLHRHGDEGPEFYALIEDTRVWFEAIAPGPGAGRDHVPRVPQLDLGEEMAKMPTEKILLRFTNALSEKQKRYEAASAKGIIRPEDSYVLAINSRGIQHVQYGGSMPLFVQAFLPIGPLQVAIDSKSGEIVDSSYQYRPAISKVSGRSVSTRAFLDDGASFCSAVLHSSVDCANYLPQFGGEFSVLHNPRARCPLDLAVFHWCEQFKLQGERLERRGPNSAVNTDTQSAGDAPVSS